jgi:hypothetical protein
MGREDCQDVIFLKIRSVDENEAPEGYKAIPIGIHNCGACALRYAYPLCSHTPCTPNGRKDKQYVIFVKRNKVDENEAPEGCRAVGMADGYRCPYCALRHTICPSRDCLAEHRKDKCNVYFIKHEAKDPMSEPISEARACSLLSPVWGEADRILIKDKDRALRIMDLAIRLYTELKGTKT